MSKKILIVDDSPTLRRVLSYLFNKKNYQTKLAGNGKECLDIIEKENYNFDLIVLDMNMPVMNGIEVLEAFREMDDFNIPVLILTANNEIKNKGLELGASYFLTKPFKPKNIIESINKIFND
jgi:two-component system chemotaxis response regulator CheY